MMFSLNGRIARAALAKPFVVLGMGCLTVGAALPGLSLTVKPVSEPIATTPSRTAPVLMAQLFKRTPTYGQPTYGQPTYPGNRVNIGQNQTVIQAGQTIATHYGGKNQLILQTGESRKLALSVNQDIRNQFGQVVIPAETQIEGEIVPIEGGGQFNATRIIVNGVAYPFAAQSPVLNDVKDPQQTSVGAIAGDAAIGAAGGIVVGQVLGQRGITLEQVLGGAATGVIVGNVTAPRAVVLDPGTEVKLQLTEAFRI